MDILSIVVLIPTYSQHAETHSVKQSLAIDIPGVFCLDIDIIVLVFIFWSISDVLLFGGFRFCIARSKPSKCRSGPEFSSSIAICHSRLTTNGSFLTHLEHHPSTLVFTQHFAVLAEFLVDSL